MVPARSSLSWCQTPKRTPSLCRLQPLRQGAMPWWRAAHLGHRLKQRVLNQAQVLLQLPDAHSPDIPSKRMHSLLRIAIAQSGCLSGLIVIDTVISQCTLNVHLMALRALSGMVPAGPSRYRLGPPLLRRAATTAVYCCQGKPTVRKP